jgi:hypothetical protein
VTLGNLVGGLLFTGLFLYWTYSPERAAATRTADSTPLEPVVTPAAVRT